MLNGILKSGVVVDFHVFYALYSVIAAYYVITTLVRLRYKTLICPKTSKNFQKFARKLIFEFVELRF